MNKPDSAELDTTQLANIVEKYDFELLTQWISEQIGAINPARALMRESELRDHCRQFVNVFTTAIKSNTLDTASPPWQPVRDFLAAISRSRATQGFTPSETASFIFSLRAPLWDLLQRETLSADQLPAFTRQAALLIDKLGLYTFEQYVATREGIITRQQHEMLELSTPVVRLFEGVVAVPLIGTLDSGRTQVVMENLLQGIVDHGAAIAIIDITGVPTVDTLVAQHLLKTVAAARLMGADCIISGIRPQIAQTIVHLGVNLQDVITKATLSDALILALQRTGMSIQRATRAAPSQPSPATNPGHAAGD